MWAKDKSYHVRTKDRHIAARKRSVAKPGDLQTLREDREAGFVGELKKVFSRKDAKKSRKGEPRFYFAALHERLIYSSPSEPTTTSTSPSPSLAAAGTTIGSRAGITMS